MCSTENGDGAGQAAKFLLIHDDSLCRACRCVQPAFTLEQPYLDPLERSAGQQHPGVVNTEDGPALQQLLGKRLEPTQYHRFLPTPAQLGHGPFDQVRRPLEIFGHQRVADRLSCKALTLVPRAGPKVQNRDLIGTLLPQMYREYVTEERVIAVPLTLVVEGNDEEVAPLESL